MAWFEHSDLGTDIVAHVHDAMKVSDKWSLNQDRGFTWWAGDYAQRVWADAGVYHNAETVYRVHSEIDFLAGRGHAGACEQYLSHAMEKAVMSALVYDGDQDMFRLHASIYASGENARTFDKLFMAATVLQLDYAQRHAQEFAALLNAAPATSGHPNGPRTDKDPMLKADEMFFRPAGEKPSRWIGVPEWQEASNILERLAEDRKTDRATNLDAQFRFGDEFAKLEVTTEFMHDELGHGLHFLLLLPMHLPAAIAAHATLELNNVERAEWRWFHFLGSWCCHEDQLAFACFIPNTSYNPDLLPAMTQAMGRRAIWIEELFSSGYRLSAPPAA